MKLWVANFVARYYSYQTVEAIKECFERLFRDGVIDQNEEVFCTVTKDTRFHKPTNNRAVLMGKYSEDSDNPRAIEHYDMDLFGKPYIRLYKNFYVASVQPYLRNGARYPFRTICVAIANDGGRHVCYVQASVFRNDADELCRKGISRYNSLILDTEANATTQKGYIKSTNKAINESKKKCTEIFLLDSE